MISRFYMVSSGSNFFSDSVFVSLLITDATHSTLRTEHIQRSIAEMYHVQNLQFIQLMRSSC